MLKMLVTDSMVGVEREDSDELEDEELLLSEEELPSETEESLVEEELLKDDELLLGEAVLELEEELEVEEESLPSDVSEALFSLEESNEEEPFKQDVVSNAKMNEYARNINRLRFVIRICPFIELRIKVNKETNG